MANTVLSFLTRTLSSLLGHATQLPGSPGDGGVRQGERAAAHHPLVHTAAGGGGLPHRQGRHGYQGDDPSPAGRLARQATSRLISNNIQDHLWLRLAYNR